MPVTVADISKEDWEMIVEKCRGEECVPFLGAGASLGFGNRPGLPTAGNLAEELANPKMCNYPGTDKRDFLRVAQYFEMVRDRYSLSKFIQDRLRGSPAQPSIVHETVARRPFRYVLTTNYDDLMENAFRREGKSPQVVSYERRGNPQDLVPPTERKPLVYKLHGSLDDPLNMALTEDDIIDFLACIMLGEPPLPSTVKGLFQSHSILFIGYGLRDWNVRVMLRAMRGRKGGAPPIASFAVQRKPGDPGLAKEWVKSVLYWDKKETLKCYDVDAVEFIRELNRRW